MTVTAAIKARRKRCSECGELKDDVVGRQRLCSDCEEGKSYCKICDEHVDRAWGSGCKHVGWNDAGGFECGCGTYDVDAEYHKESFVELLKRLKPLFVERYEAGPDEPLLPRLAELIAENRFWTQWHGPMIGGPPDLSLRYSRPDRDDYFPTLCEIRASAQEAWGYEAIDAMQLGMAWLTSLDSKSVEANQITAQWIRDFVKNQ